MPSTTSSSAPGTARAVARPPDTWTIRSAAPWMTSAGIDSPRSRGPRLPSWRIASICRITPLADTPRSKVSWARAITSSWGWGKAGDPISCHILAEAAAYASRPAPRGAISVGSSRGCCQPTERLPVVDMMLVSERTRSGRAMAMVWAIMPPIEMPTTCADSSPRWSSSPKPSSAMSASVYGGRTARPAKARTSAERRTRSSILVERPVSRLS